MLLRSVGSVHECPGTGSKYVKAFPPTFNTFWQLHKLCVSHKTAHQNIHAPTCSIPGGDVFGLTGELFLASGFGGLYFSHREVHDLRVESNLSLYTTGARKLSKRNWSESAPCHQLPTQKAHRAWKFWLPTRRETHTLMDLKASLSSWQQRLSHTGNLSPTTLACIPADTHAFAMNFLQNTHLLLQTTNKFSSTVSEKAIKVPTSRITGKLIRVSYEIECFAWKNDSILLMRRRPHMNMALQNFCCNEIWIHAKAEPICSACLGYLSVRWRTKAY